MGTKFRAVVGVLVIAGALLVMGAVALADFWDFGVDDTAYLSKDGKVATLTGTIECTGSAEIQTTLVRDVEINGKFEELHAVEFANVDCTGEVQQWTTKAEAEPGLTLEPGWIEGVAYIATRNEGRVVDEHYLHFETTFVGIEEQVQAIMGAVDQLVAEAELNEGQGDALNAKLKAALASLDKGNPNAACNQLVAFLKQVQDLISTGELSQAHGEDLFNDVRGVSKQLGIRRCQ